MKTAVIIPIYNVADFLGEAIESVIQQQADKTEVIVVDDGSEEAAAAHIQQICSAFPEVQLVRQPQNAGPAAARSAGLQETQADYVVFLDADDCLHPQALAIFHRHLSQHPDAIACYGKVRMMQADGTLSTSPPKPDNPDYLLAGEPLLRALVEGHQIIRSGGAICIRQEVVANIPAVNHHLRLGEDWVLWCHLALRGTIIPAGEDVVLYKRSHGQNISQKLLETPDVLFDSVQTVFEDAAFAQALGEDYMCRHYREAMKFSHAYLAKKYGQVNDRDEAQYHLQQTLLFKT